MRATFEWSTIRSILMTQGLELYVLTASCGALLVETGKRSDSS